jgi:diguanylate cyclase (GGDEF)-like protein
MSFRARLAVFFALIVVVPMAAVGLIVFRLIDDSQAGKARAVADQVAVEAAGVYNQASRQASLQARSLARRLAFVPGGQLPGQIAAAAADQGLVRVVVTSGLTTLAAVGSPAGVAPGVAVVTASAGHPARTFAVSELSATALARELAGGDAQIVVRDSGRALASTLPGARRGALPRRGEISIGSATYRVITQSFPGFGGLTEVSVLSDLSAPGQSVATDRLLAAIFIAGFLILAFFFSLLASRALGGQLTRFLEAARRLAGGDFSSPVPTAGRDEFAQLGEEFNEMSRQLERRLDELEQERRRAREAIRRIGGAFASGFDRSALLELTLETATDATEADRGRISARITAHEALSEAKRVGHLADLHDAIFAAERAALSGDGIGQAAQQDEHVATVALGPVGLGGPTHGLITVCRSGREFSGDDLELLRSLAAQATLALSNLNLHLDVQRQAITDELTGLINHGHFQALLGAEMEEVRRYGFPVALVMFDIDNFKQVNDTHGHQVGDQVLRAVADALRSESRDVDLAARYGGEELALILPHTDADGAAETAERVRLAIMALEIPIGDDHETLHVTTSIGVAATLDGDKDALIAAADSALYAAKREGKNRTVRADRPAAAVRSDE